jgi:hypothetical protein
MAYINRESEYFCQEMARFHDLIISDIRDRQGIFFQVRVKPLH